MQWRWIGRKRCYGEEEEVKFGSHIMFCGRKNMMTMTTLVEKVTQNLRKRFARRCLKKSTGELNFSCESTNFSF